MSNNVQVQSSAQTVNSFSAVLKNYERSIAQLLQTKYGISAEEFYVTCVNAVKKNPKLLHCDPRSLFGAILLSAEVGLRPNTPDQHAFIIPYKGEAKFQIGYKGLIEMMYRNPRVKSITAEAVFEKDEFDYGYGLDPFLKHKPHRGNDRGKVVATYSVCKLKDADPIFTVVEGHQLEEIRGFSKSKDSNFSAYTSGADVHHYMERQASIMKFSKLIPKQGVHAISKEVEYDSKFEGGASVSVPLLKSGEQEVLPKLTEGAKSNSLNGSFDDVIEEPVKQEKVPVKEEKAPVIKKKAESKKPEPKKEIVNSTLDNEVDFAEVGNIAEKVVDVEPEVHELLDIEEIDTDVFPDELPKDKDDDGKLF